MSQWKQLRILFLALTLGCVLFVLVKILLTKTTQKPKADSLFKDYEHPSYSVGLYPSQLSAFRESFF